MPSSFTPCAKLTSGLYQHLAILALFVGLALLIELPSGNIEASTKHGLLSYLDQVGPGIQSERTSSQRRVLPGANENDEPWHALPGMVSRSIDLPAPRSGLFLLAGDSHLLSTRFLLPVSRAPPPARSS